MLEQQLNSCSTFLLTSGECSLIDTYFAICLKVDEASTQTDGRVQLLLIYIIVVLPFMVLLPFMIFVLISLIYKSSVYECVELRCGCGVITEMCSYH